MLCFVYASCATRVKSSTFSTLGFNNKRGCVKSVCEGVEMSRMKQLPAAVACRPMPERVTQPAAKCALRVAAACAEPLQGGRAPVAATVPESIIPHFCLKVNSFRLKFD